MKKIQVTVILNRDRKREGWGHRTETMYHTHPKKQRASQTLGQETPSHTGIHTVSNWAQLETRLHFSEIVISAAEQDPGSSEGLKKELIDQGKDYDSLVREVTSGVERKSKISSSQTDSLWTRKFQRKSRDWLGCYTNPDIKQQWSGPV